MLNQKKLDTKLLSLCETVFDSGSGLSCPKNTLTTICSHTFAEGSWLIVSQYTPTSGGSGTANAAQNRIIKDGVILSDTKGLSDTSINLVNVCVLENANNNLIKFEAYQATANNQTLSWSFYAIRIA